MAELEQRGGRTPAPSKWDYASAPESREIVTLEERYGLFVGGEFVEPRSGDYYQTIAPASEEPLAEIPQAGTEDVALAVSSAREAFEDGWSAAAPAERAKYLYRIARILQERSREFAVLTCPSRPRISSTTRAGRTSSSTPSRTAARNRSASPGRSSPGTSRC